MQELERLLDGRERQEPPPPLSAIWPQIKVEGICIALEYEPDDDLAATVTMDHADMGFGAQTWGVFSTDELREFGSSATADAARSWSASVEDDLAFKLVTDRPPRRLSIEVGGG